MPTEELIVEIEKPAAASDIVVEPAVEKVAADAKPAEKPEQKPEAEQKPDSEMLALKSQLESVRRSEEQARQRAQQAEQGREQARDEAAKAAKQVAAGEYQLISNALSAAQSEAESAASDYETAFETGDKTKSRVAMTKMAAAQAKLLALNEGKSALDARAEQERANPPPKRQQETGDPIENYISRYSSATQAWLRAHRECVTDQKTSNRAYAAHYEATSEGISPDTPEYFEYLDTKLGFKDAPNGKVSVSSHTRAPPAPVSRDTNVAAGRLTGNKVTLTAREVDAAEQLGLTPAEYARRKVAMQKEGNWYT